MVRDRVTGAISLVLGVVVAVATYLLPKSTMPGDIGPKVFPAIAAGLLILCGLGLLLSKGSNSNISQYSSSQLKRLGAIIVLMIAYVVGMDYLGFILPNLVVLYLLCTMFAKGKKNVPVWQRVVFSLAVTLILYFSFTNLLAMKLPSGKLF